MRFTSRLEVCQGVLLLYLRLEHLIDQLADSTQPKIILDGTTDPRLLNALFPDTPIQVEEPTLTSTVQVTQVIGQDWAKTTLHGARRERWYDEVAAHIRRNRPTLVVTTLACEVELRQALVERGHSAALVRVGHFGGLRGSNAYKGYDVLLAQVYHPNREQIIRTVCALFADDATPLDERMILVSSTLTDTSGTCWEIQVPTFADPRLAALLHSRREAAMAQTEAPHFRAPGFVLFGTTTIPFGISEARVNLDEAMDLGWGVTLWIDCDNVDELYTKLEAAGATGDGFHREWQWDASGRAP